MSSDHGVLARVECADWVAAKSALGTMTCYWADLDGLHLEGAPSVQPIATHLWAFDGKDLWARLRLEGDVILFVTLTAGERATDGAIDSEFEEVAEFRRVQQKTWRADDRRVAQANLSGMPAELEVVELVGLSPLTFFSVLP
jgi:hypothetical protein